jgi:hypothetical protein
VHHCLKVFMLTAALIVPVAVRAQERDRQDNRQSEQSGRRYEDKVHNDSHVWNSSEDQTYRRYLQENHRKYHDFAKAKRTEQDNYWKWRHDHPDHDGR